MTGPPSIRRNPLRVLVVEDDIDMADSLGTLLRLWGYKVRVCNECSEALEIVDGFGPQVALLDHGLLGMDSYELARRLRGPAGACQVVLVAGTGYRSDADRRRAKAAGCDFRLTKPVDPEELHGLLQALERGPEPDQGHGTDEESPVEHAPSIRALIADPDESLLSSYRESLAAAGFEVVTATTGLECLAHLRRWVPDVLVLGDELPWGGGSGILALMAEEPDVAKAPVVVLFSGPPPAPNRSVVRACLAKPVGPAELACTVRELVAEGCVCPDARGIWP